MTEDLRSESYPGEGIFEEAQIIEERAAPRKALDDSAFREPISVLFYSPPLCVTAQTSVAEAVRLMQEHRVGGILVQEADRLVGILTERDLLNKLIGSNRGLAETAVETVMTLDPEALPIDAPIAFALNLMGEGGFRRLPLIDDAERPVGILSVKHIISYLAEFFPKEVLNLPPRPYLLHPDQIDSG
jgi:CBS domain-containing protein